MKKENGSRKPAKLALSRETLRELDSPRAAEVQGGISAQYCSVTCESYCELCTN